MKPPDEWDNCQSRHTDRQQPYCPFVVIVFMNLRRRWSRSEHAPFLIATLYAPQQCRAYSSKQFCANRRTVCTGTLTESLDKRQLSEKGNNCTLLPDTRTNWNLKYFVCTPNHGHDGHVGMSNGQTNLT
eukprot:GHVQ01025126.1.p1 GENE.GHVQ01025126.1~~GHVQ01025126.1.p1  ORF type:complete len:129 (+),score=8.18 GHVQ01025126.1:594-980(+)